MKQTTVDWLYEQIKFTNKEAYNDELFEQFQQAKEMEKQQIIDAYKYGDLDLRSADTYYNETYGSKESKIGSSLEWNGEVTQGHGVPASSQTEISDEEIEKAIIHQDVVKQEGYCHCFLEGAKWYREQLKKK